MALDGIMFEGVTVRVRRPNDYNPAAAAALGPSVPNQALNLGAIGLQPGAGMVRCSEYGSRIYDLTKHGEQRQQEPGHRLVCSGGPIHAQPAAAAAQAPSCTAVVHVAAQGRSICMLSLQPCTTSSMCGPILNPGWRAAGHGRCGRQGVCGRAAVLPGRRPVPRAALLLRAPQILRPRARQGDWQLQRVRPPAHGSCSARYAASVGLMHVKLTLSACVAS